MLDKKELVAEFGKWLHEDDEKTQDTSNSYKTYINKFLKIFPDINFTDEIKSPEEFSDHIKYYESELAEKISKAENGEKKEFSDIRSAFRALENFLEYKRYYFKGIPPSHSGEAHPIEFYQKDLINKFKNSLKTQDRVYDKLILNFRLINKILNRGSTKIPYNDFLENEILKISIITEAEEEPLSAVVRLSINPNGETTVYLNDEPATPLKIYSNQEKLKNNEPLIATKPGEISLDHKKSLHQIVQEISPSDFPELFKLSNSIIKYFEKRENISPLTISQISKLISSTNPGITEKLFKDLKNTIDRESLFKDFQSLYNEIDLVVMHRIDNSSKGK